MAATKATDSELHKSLLEQGYTQQQGKPNQYWKHGSKDVYTDGDWTSKQNSSSWQKHGKDSKY